MADYTKAFRELQLSYIFNANMASVDLSEEDGYSVFKMDNTSFSFQFADDLEDATPSRALLPRASRLTRCF